jgi:hypothetical protein
VLAAEDYPESTNPDDLSLNSLDPVRLSALSDQADRVRFTPVMLPLDDLARIFSGSDAKLRASAAYEASPVLIEDARAIQGGPPVVWRGRGEIDGFQVQPGLDFGVPGLISAGFPFPPPDANASPPVRVLQGGRVTAAVKDTLVVTGTNLTGRGVRLRFRNVATKASAIFKPAPQDVAPGSVAFRFDRPPEDAVGPAWEWRAGLYTVGVILDRPDPTDPSKTVAVTTNEVPFSVVPSARVTIKTNPPFFTERVLSVRVEPTVAIGQTASLLLGGLELPAGPIERAVNEFWVVLSLLQPTGMPTLNVKVVPFAIGSLVPGQYPVRIRINGVDSLLFDPKEKIITRYSPDYIKQLPDGPADNVGPGGGPPP